MWCGCEPVFDCIFEAQIRNFLCCEAMTDSECAEAGRRHCVVKVRTSVWHLRDNEVAADDDDATGDSFLFFLFLDRGRGRDS